MNQSVLSQIEDTFKRLSVPEQLLLIERLVRQMHQNTAQQGNDLDGQLELMAADPEIQNELNKIEQEFDRVMTDSPDLR